jgi:hypothetical protein
VTTIEGRPPADGRGDRLPSPQQAFVDNDAQSAETSGRNGAKPG